jgi:uncharacterized membrane protein
VSNWTWVIVVAFMAGVVASFNAFTAVLACCIMAYLGWNLDEWARRWK